MQFNELSHKLLTGENVEFPPHITLPTEAKSGLLSSKNIFWEKIRQLRKFTDASSDKFSDLHEGSTGWEYDMIMIYVDGNFFYSEPTTSKQYSSVSSHHNLDFKLDFDAKNLILKDMIYINDKHAGTITHKGEKELLARQEKIKDGKFVVGTACHFHSHPQIQVKGTSQRIYTFFSRVDFSSFLNTRTPLFGLVTDRLWVLAKPKPTLQIPSESELHHLTQLEVNKDKGFADACGDLMNRYEYVLYTANFGDSKLTRLTSGAG